MEQSKIETLYKLIINGLVINDRTLLNSGFTNEDIDKFIIYKILIPTENKTYKLVYVDKLRQYGVRLLSQGDVRTANDCFRICYNLAPNGKNICLQYFLANIVKKDYQKALEIFSNLEKIQPEKNKKDYNLYLYLLSNLIELEGEYLKRAKSIKEEDILLVETYLNKKENSIRIAIMKDKFTYAYQLINPLISRDIEYSVKYELIRKLVIEIAQKERKFKENLTTLIKEENYEKIIEELNKKLKYSHLSKIETYIYLIAKAIIEIKRTNLIPVKSDNKSNDMYNVLLTNDFKKALEINEHFLDLKHENKSKDLVHIMLIKLNKLIDEINVKETNKIEESIEVSEIEITKTDIFDNQKVKDAEEMANYLRSLNLSLEETLKKYGFLGEQALLIKLIYVRDYYIEGQFILGDKLLKEIDNSIQKTELVETLLNEIKRNKQNYLKLLDKYVKVKKIN